MSAPSPRSSPGDDDLQRMPFDQYGRYRMVQEAVAAAHGALGHARLRILDVGGYYQEADGTPRLPSQQFLGDQSLTVLDLPACDLPGYVQGDGTDMRQFADGSFDLVISCDTLEHIPPPLRERFIGELVRVARYGVLLICPVYSYATAVGEQVLDRYVRAELHTRHPALLEHLEYGLPSLELIDGAFAAAGCEYRRYPSGYLYTWLPMMLVKHYLERFAADGSPVLQHGLDELYNQSFARYDRCPPSYRWLAVAASDNANNWLGAVDAALEPTVDREERAHRESWHGLAGQLLWLLRLGQEERQRDAVNALLQEYIVGQRNHIANLDRIIADLDRVIADQQLHIQWLNSRIAGLEERAHWLEGQAAAARQQLDAIANGALMRLLKWLRAR